MTKRITLLFIVSCLAEVASAQLTLNDCKRLAMDNYPAIKQYQLIEQSRDYSVSNALKGWLPRVSVTATAAWFTDVANVPQPQGNLLGDVGNSLYNGGVRVTQPIFDGGEISAHRRETEAKAGVERERTNIIMYDINARIEQLFFGVLTLDESIRQNRLLQDNLDIAMRSVRSLERGGLSNRGDIESVSVEQLKARQQEEQLKASRKAYLAMLSTFIHKPLTDTVSLVIPARPQVSEGVVKRPELNYYEAKDHLLDIRLRNLDARLMPRLSAFGMGMYHNRLIGMMKNSLFAAGLTLSWNIGALYTRSNDRHLIETERSLNSVERETFLFNTALSTRQSNGVIDALERQLSLDADIIALRESILSKSEKKVQNGTETVNEMLRNINAVSEAKLTRALHELQLTQELYNLKNINNN